jgi:predicted deacetylase
MAARYIVRFDDICPTMNWHVWSQLQPVLEKHGIKPILAVVPDNRDPHLVVDAPKADFWPQVRAWQAAGWTIALHGFQHTYSSSDPGLLGINAFSEFAGLAEPLQRQKLQQALRILEDQGVRPDAWVAPAHSFDAVTVKLLLEAGIRLISDGFYMRPVKHLGALWIPQQFWRFRRVPVGLWTVCYHHNQFDEAAITRFATDIAGYADRIVGVREATAMTLAQERSLLDRAMSVAWLAALRLKRRQAAA